MMRICEFYIKPRGVLTGKTAYDAQATVCDENGENKLYVYADRWGKRRRYTVARCSQMEEDLEEMEVSEEEMEETEAKVPYAASLTRAGLGEAAQEVLAGPDGPMLLEDYMRQSETKASVFYPVFQQLDAVIDMMEEFGM